MPLINLFGIVNNINNEIVKKNYKRGNISIR